MSRSGPASAGASSKAIANTCHSLDYVRINAPFLNRQGWETEVNKMITAFGAPIGPTDTKIIVDYLVTNYGTGN